MSIKKIYGWQVQCDKCRKKYGEDDSELFFLSKKAAMDAAREDSSNETWEIGIRVLCDECKGAK